MNVLKAAKEQEEYIVALRRDFHTHPEVSWKEYRTSSVVMEELDKTGIPYVKIGETGVVATIQGQGPGKAIALRADLDALPIAELNDDLPYRSQNEGVMHACGHDGHTACLLGTARVLHGLREHFNGTVKLFFEPAEEFGGSLHLFEQAGQLEGLDGCFAAHLWADMPVGKISLEAGPKMAGTDLFTLKITGKGGHASMPHQGVDAIVVAASVIQNLQTIVSRELSPLEPCVVTIGKLTAGQRFNAIADTAILEGNLRTFNLEIRNEYRNIIERIASNTAKAFRAEAEIVDYTFGTPPVINPEEGAAFARQTAVKLFGEGCLGEMQRVMAGEDFAIFMEKVPGVFAFVGAGNPDKNCNFPHHHGKFNIDEDALTPTVALYAQYAMDFLAR